MQRKGGVRELKGRITWELGGGGSYLLRRFDLFTPGGI